MGGGGESDEGLDASHLSVGEAVNLTLGDAGTAWDSADSNTLNAWHFGDDTLIPALNYADYDGAGTVFDCSQFPANACKTLPLTLTLLPGQRAESRSSQKSGGPSPMPIPTTPSPGGGGGGGGSLGLWALVALALAHPLGSWRRRPRHSRAPSHLSDPLA